MSAVRSASPAVSAARATRASRAPVPASAASVGRGRVGY